MDTESKILIQELKKSGLSDQVIDAAWPSWWNDEAASSPSARAELRFALSRKLGLSPQSLLGERVEFIWQDAVRFKNLTARDNFEQGAIASFAIAISRLLLRATANVNSLVGITAAELRNAILESRGTVDLAGLLSACWGLGVPVAHLRVFPLPAKRMRAMVVEADNRHAILLGRDETFPAPIAFTLAHEIGHAALGHVKSGIALLDIRMSSFAGDDTEEQEADAYGLELLTGSTRPSITTSTDTFGPRELAQACLAAGPKRGIEPGTLALCVGYLRENWAVSNEALKHIYSGPKAVWNEVNKVAARQLDWSEINEDSSNYLRAVMALNA